MVRVTFEFEPGEFTGALRDAAAVFGQVTGAELARIAAKAAVSARRATRGGR